MTNNTGRVVGVPNCFTYWSVRSARSAASRLANASRHRTLDQDLDHLLFGHAGREVVVHWK